MNISCGCLLFYYLFRLFQLSPIHIHLSTLCHFNRGGVYPRCWIRFPPGAGVLIFQFYFPLLKYHHSFSLHLLKRENSSLSHCVIRCRPKKNVSWWLLSTALILDDHHRVIGPYHLQLNRCKCVFFNLIDYFWRGLDGGYTCRCICYNVGWDKGE